MQHWVPGKDRTDGSENTVGFSMDGDVRGSEKRGKLNINQAIGEQAKSLLQSYPRPSGSDATQNILP